MKNQTQKQRTCNQCGDMYYLNIKYSNKQILNSKFCSRECQYKGKTTFVRVRLKEIEMTCQVCKGSFKAYKSSRRFGSVHCSRRCAGVTNSMRQKGKVVSAEVAAKIVATRRNNGSYIFSEEHKRKIREYQRGRDRTGSKNPNWKGGYDIKNALRKTKAYAEWRKLVFTRDKYTCVWCGIKFIKGVTGRVNIQADHIKSFASYPELRLDVSNGRTLCLSCHIKTDTWGGKNYKKHEK